MVVTILIALLLPVFGREIGMLTADFIGASYCFAGMVGCPLGYQSAYPFNRVYRALHFRAE